MECVISEQREVSKRGSAEMSKSAKTYNLEENVEEIRDKEPTSNLG